jgi:SAM-dependent methyltransferase
VSPSGTAYAAHFDTLATRGVDVHAEARLVASLVAPGGSVLDAGCGTGRVAIRLAASGYRVAGVDLDPSMLAEARRRAPSLDWRLADLADLEIPGAAPFDAAVAAGNVFPYLTAGTGTAVLVNRGAAATRRAPHRSRSTPRSCRLAIGPAKGSRSPATTRGVQPRNCRCSTAGRARNVRPAQAVTTRSASIDAKPDEK